MDEFSTAPYDTACRIVTALLFLMALFFGFLYFFLDQFPLAAVALLPATLLVTWGLAPRSYSLEGATLIVHRPFGNKTITLEKDLMVQPDPEAGKGAVKVAGNGGLFGYYGSFRSGRLGFFRAYATNWKHGVVVKTGGKTYVVTPDEPEHFVSRIVESAGTGW